jgi:hypothetical protein
MIDFRVHATICRVGGPIDTAIFGPFTKRDAAEACMTSVSGRENCMSATVVAMEHSTESEEANDT